MTEDAHVLHVPAREVPLPGGLSPEAEMMLSVPPAPASDYPPLDQPEAWKAFIAAGDEMALGLVQAGIQSVEASVETIEIDGVTVYVVTPQDLDESDDSIVLDLHGGALISGSGEMCKAMAVITADMTQRRVWSVDYRMPPDHPFPAALDDAIKVYRHLVETVGPDRFAVSGASAGGNIAPALILRARDEGLPLPAAAVLLTPEVDLTESGDTFHTLMGIDSILTRSLMPANLLYAGGHDLTHPYVSPLFGDFSKGFPPTFLQSGTRDLFLSNTVRFHRALRLADIEADLHVWDAATHVQFPFGPESDDRKREMRLFLARHLPANQTADAVEARSGT